MSFKFIISLTLVLFSISSILPPSSSQDVDALTEQYSGLISQGLGAVQQAVKENGGQGGTEGLQNLIQSATSANAKCVQKLLPCQEYFRASNSNVVAQSCCVPLRVVIADDMACLCNIAKTAGVMKTVNVTMQDIVNVAKACETDPDLSVCDDISPSPAPAMSIDLPTNSEAPTDPTTAGPATTESPSGPSGTESALSPAPGAAATKAADESGGLRMYNMEKSSLIVLVLTFMLLAIF